MKRTFGLVVAFAALFAAQGFCGGAPEGTDWRQWRGPNRDKTTPDSNWNPEALKDLKIIWKVSVGVGTHRPSSRGETSTSWGEGRVSRLSAA